MKVLLTGATGFIGRHLCEILFRKNYEIIGLSRNPEGSAGVYPFPIKFYQWSPLTELPPQEALTNVDVVIHLAGESIVNKRWTKKQKQKIYDSRILSTRNLAQALDKYQVRPRLFLSASAIGFYGADRGEAQLDEDSPAANDFMGSLCQAWETEASKAPAHRWASIRVGLVLG